MTLAACRYVKGGLSRSLTVRNLQLSLYGLPFSMAYMWLKDGVTRSNMVQVGSWVQQGSIQMTHHPLAPPLRVSAHLVHSGAFPCTCTCISSSRAYRCICRALTWWRGRWSRSRFSVAS